MSPSPEQSLNPEAQSAILAVKKEVRTILLAIRKLDPSSDTYKQHETSYAQLRELYSELNLLELTPQVKPIEYKTPREERKARRAERREARKEHRADRRKNRKEERKKRKEERKKNRELGKKDDGVLTEIEERFAALKKKWDATPLDEIFDDIDQFLDKAEAFLVEAKNFLALANTVTGGNIDDEIKQVEAWIKKAEVFIAKAKNIADQVEQYAEIFKELLDAVLSLPSDIKQLADGIASSVSKSIAKAERFLKVADRNNAKFDVDKLQEMIEKVRNRLTDLSGYVDLALKDVDENGLPDWFDKIQDEYKSLLGGSTDLIPGTQIDDKLLLKLDALNGVITEFIREAKKYADNLDLQGKIKIAQQWLGQTNKIISSITGFIDHIEDGDLVKVYEDIKSFKLYLESTPSILDGTTIDDKLIADLNAYGKKAENFLMNLVTGGDPEKESTVRSLLSDIDDLITSSGKTPDYSSKHKSNRIVEMVNISQLTTDEQNAMLVEYGLDEQSLGENLERILFEIILQSKAIEQKIKTKYDEFIKVGHTASEEFKDAKTQFTAAVEAHNKYLKAINSIGFTIIKGILGGIATMINPTVGSVVLSVGDAFFGKMDGLNDHIDDLIPDDYAFLGELAKGVVAEAIPQFGKEDGIVNMNEDGMVKALAELYSNGITVKYNEVYGVNSQLQGKVENLLKNVQAVYRNRSNTPEQIIEVNKKILVLAKIWKTLNKEIGKQYIDMKKPSVPEKTAFFNASRFHHSMWLVKFPKKEIRIGNSMIDQFTDFKIMAESKAEWDTGFWASAGRGFFGFFGADPFDYRKELAKLKKWAFKEQDILRTEKAWLRTMK